MAKYTYKLSDRGVEKGVNSFNVEGKTYKVDMNNKGAFRLEVNQEFPESAFMGLKLLEVKD